VLDTFLENENGDEQHKKCLLSQKSFGFVVKKILAYFDSSSES